MMFSELFESYHKTDGPAVLRVGVDAFKNLGVLFGEVRYGAIGPPVKGEYEIRKFQGARVVCDPYMRADQWRFE